MDLVILKRKIDGFKAGNGTLQNVPVELLLELRQMWENYAGPPEPFRRELGMKVGTLRKLLVDSKKLNHVLASSSAVGFVGTDSTEPGVAGETAANSPSLELIYDGGQKVIRFPSVDTLIEFLRKAS